MLTHHGRRITAAGFQRADHILHVLAALGLDKLSVQERLDLIETLWDSLPDQVEMQEIPAWHLVELAKRRGEANAKENGGSR